MDDGYRLQKTAISGMGVNICTSHWHYWRDWLCGSDCRIRYVAVLLFL